MKEFFIEKRFSKDSILIINKANEIINLFQSKGYTLTLRQLYYQFIAIDFFANNEKNYKRLGNIINNARLAGKVDWDTFEDRTRYIRGNNFWESPSQILYSAIKAYRKNFWIIQSEYIEVWK